MKEYYLSLLSPIPKFLEKYLKDPALLRLKKVGYFCGMDYASKDIYNFAEYISRYDHSLTVALLTFRFTKRKKDTIAALYHDIATPCFSHVIDYMNKDYERQESTEEYTAMILKNDSYLHKCLKQDHLQVEDIIDFKKYSIVDNDRPKMCADRFDGVILTGLGWTKNISKNEVKELLQDLTVYQNEDNEDELGFKSEKSAKKVQEVSKTIDIYCHSNEDNYMMELLANMTRILVENKELSYDDLYYLTEEEVLNIFKNSNNANLKELYQKFQSIKKKDIPKIEIPNIKIRNLCPLVEGNRLL